MFFAVNNIDIAVRILFADVAGVEPPEAHYLLSQLRGAKISYGTGRRRNTYFSTLPHGQNIAAVIKNLNPAPCGRAHALGA